MVPSLSIGAEFVFAVIWTEIQDTLESSNFRVDVFRKMYHILKSATFSGDISEIVHAEKVLGLLLDIASVSVFF